MATPLQLSLSSVPKIQEYKKLTDSTESVNTLQTYRAPFYSCHPPGVTKVFIKGETLFKASKNKFLLFTFEETFQNTPSE